MIYTFEDAIRFNGDIGVQNTSSVMTTKGMFENAVSFNQDLHLWDTSKVSNMHYMFRRVLNDDYIFNQQLPDRQRS